MVLFPKETQYWAPNYKFGEAEEVHFVVCIDFDLKMKKVPRRQVEPDKQIFFDGIEGTKAVHTKQSFVCIGGMPSTIPAKKSHHRSSFDSRSKKGDAHGKWFSII